MIEYRHLKTGDLILIIGDWIGSKLIENLTGVYSHIAMVIRYPPEHVFYTDNPRTGQVLSSRMLNNVFVFQASGMTEGVNDVFRGEPMEGVQLNHMEDYLAHYGSGKMYVRQLATELSEEEEAIVHRFVEKNCTTVVPYEQDPSRLMGACWFSLTNIHWPGSSLPPLSQQSYFCSELVLSTYLQVPRFAERLADIRPCEYAPQKCDKLLIDLGITDTKRTLIYDNKPEIKAPTYHSSTSWLLKGIY